MSDTRRTKANWYLHHKEVPTQAQLRDEVTKLLGYRCTAEEAAESPHTIVGASPRHGNNRKYEAYQKFRDKKSLREKQREELRRLIDEDTNDDE